MKPNLQKIRSPVAMSFAVVSLCACSKFSGNMDLSSSAGSGNDSPATSSPTAPTLPLPVVTLALGSDGLRMASLDQGQTWLYTDDGQIDDNDCWSYRSAAYGNGIFVAVTSTGGFGRISSSPDGVHWRHYESNTGADGITYGGGQFVADSFTSTDGYNFNFRSLNVDVGNHQAFAYLNGTYFMSGSSNGIAISSDGSNFTITLANYTSPDLQAFYSNITQFAVGNGIVVGMGPYRLVSSSNGGQTWTNQDNFFGYGMNAPTLATQYNSFGSIIFDGTQFVVYGGTGNYGTAATTWTSTDGVNWTMTVLAGATATNPAANVTNRSLFLVGLASGSPSSNLVGFIFNGFSNISSLFNSTDLGTTWNQASSFMPSTYYDFSTSASPIANPVLTNFGVNVIVSGQASSDPGSIPTMPASVLYTHAQLLTTACNTTLPPGR